jgi:uncharacterized membrane protein
MISPVALWPPIAGVVVLAAGLVAVRHDLAASRGLDKLIAAAGALYAAPLAVFGMQHLIVAQSVQMMVPAWMPWRLFWAYLVGVALIAGALSIAVRKYVRLSASLLAAMIFLFVLMIHIPSAFKVPGNRIFWIVTVRDTAFAAGALVLAGTKMKELGMRGSDRLILIGRLAIGVAVVFFGVQHFLHPEFAPGVPMEKITPAWVPLARAWGYMVGSFLLVAGAGILIQRFSRRAASWVGVVMLVLTVCLYLPIYMMASGTGALVEGVNYVADTMLFAGTALLLAAALRRDASARIMRFPSAA